MLDSRELLRHLKEQGVHLYADGDRLRLNAPKGVVTPALQAAIAERKLELLNLIREISSPSLDIPVTPVSREQAHPLSVSQEQLWGSMQMAGDRPLYNMYLAFRLCGELNRDALSSSLAYLVQRHEPLRTCFATISGQPFQQVQTLDGWSLSFLDLTGDPNPRLRMEEYIQRESAYPFDPLKETLFRASLLQLSEDDHILVLVMHHLISDGWSWDVFLRELSAAYAAAQAGNPVNLPSLPVQYLDFASWQRKFVDSPRFAEQKQNWIETLSGVAPLELPLDAARIPAFDFEGRRAELTLPAALTVQLQALSVLENATPFMTLLAAFKAVLHRVTGQQDLLVGTPVSGRVHSSLQNIIGYFNNILPLRTSVPPDGSFRGLLGRVRTMALAAYENADVPLHCLTDHPDLAQVPFTRAVFAVLDGTGHTLALNGLQVEPLPVYNHTANFDLFLTVMIQEDSVRLVAEYHSSLFKHETIHNLLSDYAELLLAALKAPDLSLAGLLPSPRTSMKSIEGLPTQHEYVAPRTPLETRLAVLWEEMFNRQPIGVLDNFFEIGGHSLLALRLFARIEQELGTSLPLSMLFETMTVASQAKSIEAKPEDASWDVFVAIQPNGSKPPFFAIHGVEGGVLGYRDLAYALGDDQPVLGLQAAGQDGRQAFDKSIEDMASRYIEVMRSHQPQGPYRMGGYCFGGVVAFEMARQLEKVGEKVSLLAVFESAIPEESAERVPLLHRFGIVLRHLPVWIKDYSNMSPHQLRNRLLSTYKKIWAKIQRNAEIDRRMRVEETLDINVDHLPSRHVEMTDACMNAALKYIPGEYNGVVTMFRARNRSLNEVVFGTLDPKMGWGRLAKGGVDVRLVDGFHRNMHLAPYVSSLAGELRKCLDADSKG